MLRLMSAFRPMDMLLWCRRRHEGLAWKDDVPRFVLLVKMVGDMGL